MEDLKIVFYAGYSKLSKTKDIVWTRYIYTSVLSINFLSLGLQFRLVTRKLAALAQALITLGSVNSPELHEQPEQLTRAP